MSDTKHNMPAIEERPLVTFALFAYNQEKYIREAVEGAFAQTYEPLEIILSDDCSTDRTFEIMEEMAAAYQGPHSVRCRKNCNNIGTIDHFLTVARESNGDLYVVAAGDDISYSHRVEKLNESFRKNRSAALYSATDECDDLGKILNISILPDPLQRIQNLFNGCKTPIKYSGMVRNIPGYSAAYRTDFIAQIPFCMNGALNEDALTTYIVNLAGESIDVVEDTLMVRRLSLTSVSSASTYCCVSDVARNENVIQEFSKSTLNFIDYFSSLRFLCNETDYDVILKRLLLDVNYYKIVASFWDLPPHKRISLVCGARKAREFAYIIPRLLGMRLFCRTKLVFSDLCK